MDENEGRKESKDARTPLQLETGLRTRAARVGKGRAGSGVGDSRARGGEAKLRSGFTGHGSGFSARKVIVAGSLPLRVARVNQSSLGDRASED